MAAIVKVSTDSKYSVFLANVNGFNETTRMYVVTDITDSTKSYNISRDYIVDHLRKQYSSENVSVDDNVYALFPSKEPDDSLTIMDPEAPSYNDFTSEFYKGKIIDVRKKYIKVNYDEGDSAKVRYTDFFLRSDCYLLKKKLHK